MIRDVVYVFLLMRIVLRHRKAGNENLWLFTLTHHSLLPFNSEVDGWIREWIFEL